VRARAATIRDVAEAAGVSTATVSRVVNGDRRVHAETAEKVRRAIDDLGYNMNQVARSLKTRATRTVGVVAPSLESGFFTLLTDSLDRELSAHGYSLLFCSSRESAAEEAKRLRLFAERLVDGIIMVPALESGRHVLEARDRGIPIVLVDRLAGDLSLDAVLVDNEGGAYEATMALVKDGYERIGFIGGSVAVTTSRERYEGYRRAMAEASLAVEPRFERFGSLHIDSGYRAMADLLSQPDAPDAYFIVNADNHVGATNYLMTEGAAFRDKVVFAAFDEMPYAPLLQFCRYSVSQPMAEMGVQAARMVLDRIEGRREGEPEVLRLKTTLIRHGRGAAP
jgi:LacI family transcriptional regulator